MTNEQKQAIVKMLGVVLAIVLIFILLFAIIAIKNGGKKSNVQVEVIMKNAAINYVADHSEVVSDKIYGSTEIEVDTLLEEDYMKSLGIEYK